METENTFWLFSVSIIHNLKIRELSDGNRVMVQPNGLLAMGPTIFGLWVMETENWVMETSHPNSPLVFAIEKNIVEKSLSEHYISLLKFGSQGSSK